MKTVPILVICVGALLIDTVITGLHISSLEARIIAQEDISILQLRFAEKITDLVLTDRELSKPVDVGNPGGCHLSNSAGTLMICDDNLAHLDLIVPAFRSDPSSDCWFSSTSQNTIQCDMDRPTIINGSGRSVIDESVK